MDSLTILMYIVGILHGVAICIWISSIMKKDSKQEFHIHIHNEIKKEDGKEDMEGDKLAEFPLR